MVNVPVVISENSAKSFNEDDKSMLPANFPNFLFLELISVREANDSTPTSNSPVNAPASAFVRNPLMTREICQLILPEQVLVLQCQQKIAIFNLLLSTPSSEIFHGSLSSASSSALELFKFNESVNQWLPIKARGQAG